MQAFLVAYMLVALVVCVCLMLFSILRQDRQKALYLTITATALFIYVIGYLVKILATTPEAVMTALRIENAGLPLIAPFFLLTMLSLFQPTLIKKWMLPAGLGYGFVVFLIVLFNDRHHLYFTSVTTTAVDGAFHAAELGYGPLYALGITFSAACVLTAYAVLARRYARGTPKLRTQMRPMAFWPAVAFGSNLLKFTGWLPAGLDPAPLAMAVSLLFISYALFKYKLLDLVPIASTAAIETMEDAIVVLDSDYTFQYCNRSAKRLFPKLASFFGTEPIAQLDDWPDELKDQRAPGEVMFTRRTDEYGELTYLAYVSAITSGSEQRIGWTYVIHDVTKTTQMMQRLQELATTDPLTGILNRRQFYAMARRELEVSARLGLHMSLIMFDLDNFKEINDAYGHQAGDFVLCAVVRSVKAQLRSYDIFARYGGEEFVIFTTSNAPYDLRSFAERLRSTVEKSEIMFEGVRIPVTASFGAVRVRAGSDFEAVLYAADIAMYRAKSGGRNQVVVAYVDESARPATRAADMPQ